MKTLKQWIIEAIEHYERHAEWERKCAEKATNGSDIKIETLMAAKFNEGRASAYKEMLELIG